MKEPEQAQQQQITPEQLFQIIGELTVENKLLRIELIRLSRKSSENTELTKEE